jgi:hypothetical protein
MRFISILVLLLLPGNLHGQTVELQGGVSDFLGNGGGVVIYGPNSETRFSAGVLNGRFAYGTSTEFEMHKWDVIVGDRQFALTGGQMYLSVPVRGISVSRTRPFSCEDIVRSTGTLVGYLGKKCKGDQLQIFTGAVGDVYSSPFFFGIQRSHRGVGIGYKRELTRNFAVGTIQAIAGAKRTSLEEADYQLKHCEIRGQAGWLQNNLQISGNLSASWSHFGAMVSRSTYFFSQIANQQVTVNNFSAYGSYSRFNVSASLFQSNINTGESFNLGTHFNWFQVQISDYNSGKTSSQLLTTNERIGLHWSLAQYVTRSNGTANFNFGGGYQSNRLSAQLGYNVLYFPALKNPFQKVLSVTLGVRIRAVSINTGNIILPNGKSEWMVSGDGYQQTRLRVPSIGTGETNRGRMTAQYGHGGKYCFQLFVVDADGNPVEGASLVVGKDSIFTDSQGHASTRQKHKTMPMRVDVDNFMLPGSYTVVSAPTTATAGVPIQIVVSK